MSVGTSLLVIPDNGTTNGMFGLFGLLLVYWSGQWKVPLCASHVSPSELFLIYRNSTVVFLVGNPI